MFRLLIHRIKLDYKLIPSSLNILSTPSLPVKPALFELPTPLHRSQRALTLVELLAVIAILAIIIGISASAFTGNLGSRSLTEAGYYFENFASGARQNAISRNRLTAIVILKTPSEPITGRDTISYQTFSVFELAPPTGGNVNTSSDWKQITPWKQFGREVVADFNNTPQFKSHFFTPQTLPIVPLPTITYKGRTYSPDTHYAYQIYKPSGRLMSPPVPCNLNLVSGFVEGGELRYLPAGTTPTNYFNITFIEGNGELKITRP